MAHAERQGQHLRWQAGWCRKLGSQLYGYLLERAADDVAARGPTAAVLEDRDATQRSMLALRLMGAVHRLVLQGEAPDLARLYPSVGGRTDEVAAWRALSDLLEERADEVRSGIDRPVQTNEVGRAGALVGGFLEVARATRMPLRVLEVGASAGLNLRWDRFSYEARGSTWGPIDSPVRLCSFNSDAALPFDVDARVSVRAGCDTDPVDPTTEDGRLTLLSYLWADQVARVRLLRAALEVAAEVPAEVEKADAVEWLSRQFRPTPGVATVVFHSIVMQYLSEGDRSAFEAMVRAEGAAATEEAPVARLRMEPAGEHAEVRLTMWPGGLEFLVATSGYHGGSVRWLGLDPTRGDSGAGVIA
jgi:hypothetical protein